MEGNIIDRLTASEDEWVANGVGVKRSCQVVRSKRETCVVVVAVRPAIAPWARFAFDWIGGYAESHDGECDEGLEQHVVNG